MLSFLKVFARGIVCTVLLPLILMVWVLYGVYCLVAFIVMLIRSIILFFAGDNPTGDLKEDIEAKRILLEAEQAKVEQSQVMNMMYQNMTNMMQQQAMMQQQMPQQPVMPSQQAPRPAEFDPFIPDPVPEKPLPTEPGQPMNNNGGNDNGQSY